MNQKNSLGIDLCFKDLDNPIDLFTDWFNEAKKTEINEEKINSVIETTNFSRMKKMEIEKGFNEAKIDEITGKKINFFNLGPKNNWKNQLKIEIQNKLEDKFRKEMLELGYI